MTLEEARALISGGGPRFDRPVIVAKRALAEWQGRVVGVIPEPSLLIEQADGRRVALALSGLEVIDFPDRDDAA